VAVDASPAFKARKAQVGALDAALQHEKEAGDTQSRLDAASEWNRARVAYEIDRADAVKKAAAEGK
jgi:hypothetical protein